MNGEIDEKMKKLKDKLDKLEEQLKDIDFKEIERFGALLKWLLTLQNYVDALKKYVDTEHEMTKQGIETLESYGREIKALKEEIKMLKSGQ